jgi:AAA ATPase domain
MQVGRISRTGRRPAPLKGKAEPVRLWRATRVLSRVGGSQRVDGLEAPLTGRDTELRTIKDLFHAAADRRVPRLVLVSGPAGVGKSRLGWEFEKYADGLKAQVWWHRGRCLSYGEGVAFWALAEIVRQRLDIAEEDPAEASAVKLAAGLDRYVADPGERAYVGVRLSPERGSYGFTQDMLRQVAYDTLPHRDRKARHLAVAAHLRAAFPGDGEEVTEVIARHYLDAGRPGRRHRPRPGRIGGVGGRRPGDRARHQVRRRDRGKLDKPHPVGEIRAQPPRRQPEKVRRRAWTNGVASVTVVTRGASAREFRRYLTACSAMFPPWLCATTHCRAPGFSLNWR